MTVDVWIKLEQAAFSAWPALESQILDGWVLRYADGYTKRANSANATQQVAQLSDQQLTEVEAFFHSHQQPSIFRVTSFAVDRSVDEKLIQRGYQFNDLSLVMTVDITDASVETGDSIEFLTLEEWLELFQQVSGKIGVGQATHLSMLQAIESPIACVVLRENGQAVCCGLAVVSGDFVGLFDIATAESFRQRGLARRLCRALVSWGVEQGAETAYLQVVAGNNAAINLYENLGFRRAYEYWYRIGS